MNGVCVNCRQVQRLHGGMVPPHLIPSVWVDCEGGEKPPERLTEESTAPESTVVGTVSEVEMITLLAAAMIESGWTVLDGPLGLRPSVVLPVTAAQTLVRAMLLGSAVDDPEKR